MGGGYQLVVATKGTFRPSLNQLESVIRLLANLGLIKDDYPTEAESNKVLEKLEKENYVDFSLMREIDPTFMECGKCGQRFPIATTLGQMSRESYNGEPFRPHSVECTGVVYYHYPQAEDSEAQARRADAQAANERLNSALVTYGLSELVALNWLEVHEKDWKQRENIILELGFQIPETTRERLTNIGRFVKEEEILNVGQYLRLSLQFEQPSALFFYPANFYVEFSGDPNDYTSFFTNEYSKLLKKLKGLLKREIVVYLD